MTTAVFLDASFWVVYRNDEELRHPLARRVIADLFRQKAPIVTTLPVICEVHAYFTRNPLIRRMLLRDFYENPVVTLEEVLHEDQQAALELLRVNDDKTYSLCDALSFVVMRRLNIRRAVSFDKHFRQIGEFEIIPDDFP
jgi:uncharacterized protein